MTTTAIIINCVCVAWCIGVLVFATVKKAIARKKAEKELDE